MKRICSSNQFIGISGFHLLEFGWWYYTMIVYSHDSNEINISLYLRIIESQCDLIISQNHSIVSDSKNPTSEVIHMLQGLRN